jgi:hypothetical protein
MDCGWQNPEQAASNHSECLKALPSNAGCIGRAALPQTSGMRDVLSPLAMMISLQLASSAETRLSTILLPAGGYAALRLPFAMFTIGSGMRTRLNRPDFFSVASTKTKLSPMTIGSLSNSNTSPYSFI